MLNGKNDVERVLVALSEQLVQAPGLLWRQWSSLGIAGGARTVERWAIDPEALLVFSLEFARYEPRLFDEILDWLVVNGKWIDIRRLRGIMKSKDEETSRLMNAVAWFLSQGPHSHQRKWKKIGLPKRADSMAENEVLFKRKEGKDYPAPKTRCAAFADCGFLRETVLLRRMSKPVPAFVGTGIRFVLRALLGVGSRSECVLYLLTHEAGHPSEVTRAIGISIRGTQDALIELSQSGMVLTRVKGKKKLEYCLSPRRWWQFLGVMSADEAGAPVIWLDWIALFGWCMTRQRIHEVKTAPRRRGGIILGCGVDLHTSAI